MRRRLTTTIAAIVIAALVLTGLGTLVLLRRAARDEAQREVVRQAQAIADGGEVIDPRQLRTLGRALRLEGAVVVPVDAPRGPQAAPGAPPPGQLPPGVRQSDLDVEVLRRGDVVSGTRGSLAWAAAPVRAPRGLLAVVLTDRFGGGERRAAAFFLVAGAATVVAAIAVGDRLSRRITRPLVEAERVTGRIAAGDLDARVEVPPTADPEVGSLASSINALAASLARARGLERQFLLSVSHDLRTPLTSIRGFAEAITDGATEDHERAAKVIAAESRRLERLVGDLLDLAKLDARRFSLDIRSVDVIEVVTDTAEGFRPAADDAGVTLELDAPDGGALAARADPDRLAQDVANLVENALKFARSRIGVAVGGSGDRIEIVVVDDGPGIPEAELPRVFERLYQSQRTPARQVGSGLGLAIVAELVAAMGGAVRASSDARLGTAMTVTLNAASLPNAPKQTATGSEHP